MCVIKNCVVYGTVYDLRNYCSILHAFNQCVNASCSWVKGLIFTFQSVTFRKTSRNLARSMWWKNVKLIVIIVIVLIVRTVLLVTYFVLDKISSPMISCNC